MTQPRGLAWNALLPATWWVWTLALWLAAGGVAKAEHWPQMAEGWCIAGAMVIGLAMIPAVRALHWRWLQKISPPLDLDGYLAALGTPYRGAHVQLALEYDAPPDEAALRAALRGLGEFSVAGTTATLRSAPIATMVRVGRYGSRARPDNGRVARWFRRAGKRALAAAPPRALRVQVTPH
jgi:hypothetical protein